MVNELIKRESDGKTVFNKLQEAEQADINAKAKRIIPVDSSGEAISNSNPFPVVTINGLVPDSYDYIELGYTGDNITTVIYKTGGSDGTTVATLTLGYIGDKLTSVEKS